MFMVPQYGAGFVTLTGPSILRYLLSFFFKDLYTPDQLLVRWIPGLLPRGKAVGA